MFCRMSDGIFRAGGILRKLRRGRFKVFTADSLQNYITESDDVINWCPRYIDTFFKLILDLSFLDRTI